MNPTALKTMLNPTGLYAMREVSLELRSADLASPSAMKGQQLADWLDSLIDEAKRQRMEAVREASRLAICSMQAMAHGYPGKFL